MARNLFFGLLTLSLLTLLAPIAAGNEPWNRFRGPEGEGVAEDADPPVAFGPEENLKWKTPVHGRAWSSPVVLGDRVYLTTATEDGKQLSALCLDLETGKIVWDRVVFEVAEPRFCHPTNTYASCTPFIEPDRLYVHYGSYGTACLDAATGKTLWERRDFVSDDFRGPGSSPIVHGEELIVQFDGVDFQFLVGLDKATGKTRWRRDRDIDYQTDSGDWKKAYGTPRVIRVDGEEQLVSPAAAETLAYRLPAEGGELQPLWRFRHGGMNAATPPLFDGDRIYVTTGGGSPLALAAVRPDGHCEVTESHVAWSTGRNAPQRSGPILVDGLLFTTDDRGVATCREAATGKELWKKRLGGEFWSSPVAASGRIYAFNKEGEGFVFAADGEKYRELAHVDLQDEVNASPAIVGDALIVRTLGAVWRFEE
ncbi:outer membrane biogenesis protein BamB [Pseudobythopirellula maris]|uniref:Outer membrane biogenesis protein BamB n=1 Tax=Pseudobythopirellula maris TaxID=2527991 RepID=A0A5C5ZSG6_9BACT|nr:PQQ-binding-like beta-propeller repeat protein [Pseudobythopirellula maris]TWT90449.1 outer membrane biogenesis protein BamB [Pseudobythopirellula maris]